MEQTGEALSDVGNLTATPPPLRVGGGRGKQQHSPWSAPRQRKRGKAQQASPAPLSIPEDFEYTSPPKRGRGGELRRSNG